MISWDDQKSPGWEVSRAEGWGQRWEGRMSGSNQGRLSAGGGVWYKVNKMWKDRVGIGGVSLGQSQELGADVT